MKRILALAMAFSVAGSQAFALEANLATLQEIEKLAAAGATAAHVIAAIHPVSENLAFVGDMSGEIQAVVSRVTGNSSPVMQVVRVIKGINSKAHWNNAAHWNAKEVAEVAAHVNAEGKDVAAVAAHTTYESAAFAKKFALALTHGVTAEVARVFAHKGVALGMNNLTENKLLHRAAHAFAEAGSSAAVETAFAKFEDYLNNAANAKATTAVLLEQFTATLAREIAYELMGHLVNAHIVNNNTDYMTAVKDALGVK